MPSVYTSIYKHMQVYIRIYVYVSSVYRFRICKCSNTVLYRVESVVVEFVSAYKSIYRLVYVGYAYVTSTSGISVIQDSSHLTLHM